MRPLVVAILSASLAAAELAHAETETRLSLVYSADPAAACSGETSLRSRVAARLGADPFVEPADLVVELEILRQGRALLAHLTIRGASDGVGRGTRELASDSGDCDELYDAVALSLGVVLDPLGKRAAKASAADVPPVDVRTSSPAVVRPPLREVAGPSITEAESRRVPLLLTVGLGPWLAAGATPAVSLSLRAGAGLKLGAFRAGLEGRYDLPADEVVRGRSRLSIELLAANVLGCFAPNHLFACAAIAVGAHRVTGENLEESRGVAAPLVATGLRLGVDVPLFERVTLSLAAEGLLTLTRSTFRVSGEPVWTSPAASAGIGFALVILLSEGAGGPEPRRNEARLPKREQ